jgi:hypothetical protein
LRRQMLRIHNLTEYRANFLQFCRLPGL